MGNDKELVIYERGKELVKKGIPPEQQEILQLVLLDDMAVSLRKIEKSHKKEEFEGEQDTRTLSASGEMGFLELVNDWPYTPWVTASFLNDGDDTVYIGINGMNPYVTLKKNEPYVVDFTKADRRIEIIYYWCDAGETASVRVVGKY